MKLPRGSVWDIQKKFLLGQCDEIWFSDYDSRRFTAMPLLTARHRLRRLFLARDHIGWIVGKWKTLAWSDKLRFQLERADGRIRVWLRPYEAMDPNWQQSTVQANGGSIKMWAVFSRHELDTLIQMNWPLIGNGFIQLLRDPFDDFYLETVRDSNSFPKNDAICMGNNASCHLFSVGLNHILDNLR